MTQIIRDNFNEVRIMLDCGKVITVRTDNGTAYQLALELTDWSAMFKREDDAEEITQIIELEAV